MLLLATSIFLCLISIFFAKLTTPYLHSELKNAKIWILLAKKLLALIFIIGGILLLQHETFTGAWLMISYLSYALLILWLLDLLLPITYFFLANHLTILLFLILATSFYQAFYYQLILLSSMLYLYLEYLYVFSKPRLKR